MKKQNISIALNVAATPTKEPETKSSVICAELPQQPQGEIWASNFNLIIGKIMLNKGTKIRFLKTLDAPANEDHPDIEYAHKGETGVITKVGGCREGFWVKTDNWPHYSFGCEREEFELVT